jgi:hypothetical protein
MGWFSSKQTSSEVGDLSDKEIMDALKKGKIPKMTAKEIRKMDKDDLRKTVGEKGLGALKAAAQQRDRDRERRFGRLEQDMRSGRDPHALSRMKAEDPRRYQRLLEEEARKQGL